MVRERIVDYELASMLKDAGFDAPVERVVYPDGTIMFIDENSVSRDKHIELPNSKLNIWDTCVSAPTLDMACEWMLSEKGLFVAVFCSTDGRWFSYRLYSDKGERFVLLGDYGDEYKATDPVAARTMGLRNALMLELPMRDNGDGCLTENNNTMENITRDSNKGDCDLKGTVEVFYTDACDDDKLATEVNVGGTKIVPPKGFLIGKITPVGRSTFVEFVDKGKKLGLEETVKLTDSIMDAQAETWGEKHPAYALAFNTEGKEGAPETVAMKWELQMDCKTVGNYTDERPSDEWIRRFIMVSCGWLKKNSVGFVMEDEKGDEVVVNGCHLVDGDALVNAYREYFEKHWLGRPKSEKK